MMDPPMTPSGNSTKWWEGGEAAAERVKARQAAASKAAKQREAAERKAEAEQFAKERERLRQAFGIGVRPAAEPEEGEEET